MNQFKYTAKDIRERIVQDFVEAENKKEAKKKDHGTLITETLYQEREYEKYAVRHGKKLNYTA